MVEKLTINSLSTAVVDNPAVSIPTFQTSVALCCVTELRILEWLFIFPQHKLHLCNDHEL
jgi:hypothetical protein